MKNRRCWQWRSLQYCLGVRGRLERVVAPVPRVGVSIRSWGLSPVANGAAIPGPSVPRGSDSTSTRAELPAGWSVATAGDCLLWTWTRAAATNVDEDESEDCEGCRRLWQRRGFVNDTATTNDIAHESGSVCARAAVACGNGAAS